MEAGRVPVIVSDAFTPPEGPDWAAFSLRAAEAETPGIPALLRRHETAAAEMGANARSAWEQWFAPSVTFHRISEACKQIMARRATTRDAAGLRVRYLRKFLTPFHLKMVYRLGRSKVRAFRSQ
jgi:hypothetical protein